MKVCQHVWRAPVPSPTDITQVFASNEHSSDRQSHGPDHANVGGGGEEEEEEEEGFFCLLSRLCVLPCVIYEMRGCT